MGLDLNNPAIAAVFGGVCTGVIHIIATIIVSWINRKSLVRDLATIVHDYLSEDINYYDALSINYRELNYVKYDDTNALLANSSRMSYIRNDMYLFRDRNLRSEIYSYLFKKNSLLQDIQYTQNEIHTREVKGEQANELRDNLGKKLLELPVLRQIAEELNKSLAKYIKTANYQRA